MKILYCIPHLYNSGGMERVLAQKVNWLTTHTTHQITILTTETTPNGMKDSYFPLHEGIQRIALNIDFNEDYSLPLLAKWWGHMRRMKAYRTLLTDYIRRESIDLCISLGGKEIAFLSSLPCRTMVEFHFALNHREHLLNANHTGWVWRLLGTIRTRQLIRDARQVDTIVVLTESDKKDWQKAGCTQVVCIPNPCSLDGQEIPIKPKQSDLPPVVLAVGRLHEQKGFDMLLDAWNNVQRDNVQCTKDWTLRIVGEGEQRKKLEQQIRDLHLTNVVLAGRVENMVEEYAAASLFVLSSRYEGLPLVLIEAMWCGVPCIAFDCPRGARELLEDGRGVLVPNGDIEALAQAMQQAMKNTDEIGHNAPRALTFAHQTYSEETIMQQWERLIAPSKSSP